MKMQVVVPSFVSPYLFWVQKVSLENQLILNDLEKLKPLILKSKPLKAAAGDVVAIIRGENLCRAEIMNIQQSSKTYMCWLIDHGVIYETHDVYELPAPYKIAPGIANQACLNNILFIHESMDYNEYGDAKKVITPIAEPKPMVKSIILQFIENYDYNFVIEEVHSSGILFGDIMLLNVESENENISLTKMLAEQEVVQINHNIFKRDIYDNIHLYKNKYINDLIKLSSNANINITLKNEFVSLDKLEESSYTGSSFSKRHNKITLHQNQDKDVNEKTKQISENEYVAHQKLNEKITPNKSSESENMEDVESLRKKRLDHMRNIHITRNYTDFDSASTDSLKSSGSNRELRSVKVYRTGTESEHSNTSIKDDISGSGHDTNTEHTIKSKFLNLKKNIATNKSVECSSVKPSKINFIPAGANLGNIRTKQPYKQKSSSQTPTAKIDATEPRDVDNSSSEASTECQMMVKQHCNCTNCKHYTNDVSWMTPPKTDETLVLDVVKPAPLFKNQDIIEDCEIKSIRYSEMTKIENMKSHHVLVHGVNFPQPLKQVKQAKFDETVLRTLTLSGFVECKNIQAYAWPALFRLHNVFIIDNAKSGKTMAYLPVLATLVLDKDRYQKLGNFKGPIVIILCANSKNCEAIHDALRLLIGRNRTKILCETYPIKNKCTDLVDILITTPSILLDLIKNNSVILKRLCHLVIEDADVLFKREDLLLDRIFKVTENMLSHRVCVRTVQLVLVAEHWSNSFKTLGKKLAKVPVVCIGNPLEAARYGNVEFSLKFTSNDVKILELKRLVKDTYNIYKTIVICSSKDEIDNIEAMFVKNGIEFVSANTDSLDSLLSAEQRWNSCCPGNYRVLICTDYVFNTHFSITTANVLVNYSLPSNWRRFMERYSCFLETNRNMFDDDVKIKHQSMVIFDENCTNKQIGRFLKYFDSLGIELPKKLLELSKELSLDDEKVKVSEKVDICKDTLLFGKPCKNSFCPSRHILDKVLDTNTLPIIGKIKFKIVRQENVTHFLVQLIEHSYNGELKKFTDGKEITKNLTELLSKDRIRMIENSNTKFYAFCDDTVFYRCKLIKEKDDQVKIFLLDTGVTCTTSKNKLFELPKEFIDSPASICEVYLANLIPPYGDDNFSGKSYFKSHELLQEADYKNLILSGNIQLQLHGIFWLDKIVEEVVLSNDIEVYPFNLSKRLLQMKLVVSNESQLEGLYKMCREFDIQLPNYEKPKKQEQVEQATPQWAFFNMDSVHDVVFCAATDPHEFFVRRLTFEAQLTSLQKDLQEMAKKFERQTVKVSENKCYMTQDSTSGEYCRVIVLKKRGDQTRCFFVDYGDEAIKNVSDLKFLPDKLITKLPFQTIQCRLYGIKSIFEDWQADATNILYEYALEPQTEILRTLYAKAVSKLEPTIDNQYRYSILLKDVFEERQVLINQLLIECGLAQQIVDSFEDFEIIEHVPRQDSEDDENEERDHGRLREEQILNNQEKISNAQVEDDDDDKYDVCINNIQAFLNELNKSRVSNKPIDSKPQLPMIKNAPAVDYLTPEVLWSQTDHVIKLNIKIADVKDCNISINKTRMFKFTTEKQEKKYNVSLMLYERIVSFQHSIFGQEVKVTMIKKVDEMWPRLTLSNEKYRNIHYDIAAIPEEKDEDEKPILTLPKELDEDDEDDNDNDSDEANQIILSDCDSEYFEDVESDSF